MKKHLMLAALLIFAIQACKKEEVVTEPSNPPVAPEIDQFKMTVGDTLYDPAMVSITHANGDISVESNYNNYTYFKIVMDENIDPDTYGVDASSPFRIVFSNSTMASLYYSTAGAVTITSHNLETHKIKGTFYATLTCVGQPGFKPLSGGEFNIEY